MMRVRWFYACHDNATSLLYAKTVGGGTKKKKSGEEAEEQEEEEEEEPAGKKGKTGGKARKVHLMGAPAGRGVRGRRHLPCLLCCAAAALQ
jgi:hypothetical protein